MGYLRSLADLPKNPPITTLSVVFCIAMFLIVNADGRGNEVQALQSVGWRDATGIWHGQWWALVASAFVHIELWHLAFNIYWLWVLGGRLELQLGSLRFLVFTLAAAFVSSSMQLAVSGQTSIGYSGVGYAIFGLMWRTRGSFPEFERVLTGKTCGVFLVWMFGCLFMTWAGELQIANTAHFAGFAFGCVCAPLLTRSPLRPLGLGGMILCLVLSAATLIWAPWNPYWLADRGYHAHVAEQYERAIEYYDAALQRDPRLPGVRANREHAAMALQAQHAADKAGRIAPDAPPPE